MRLLPFFLLAATWGAWSFHQLEQQMVLNIGFTGLANVRLIQLGEMSDLREIQAHA